MPWEKDFRHSRAAWPGAPAIRGIQHAVPAQVCPAWPANGVYSPAGASSRCGVSALWGDEEFCGSRVPNCWPGESAMRVLYHHRTQGEEPESIHIGSIVAALRAQGHEVRIVGPVDIEKQQAESTTTQARPAHG